MKKTLFLLLFLSLLSGCGQNPMPNDVGNAPDNTNEDQSDNELNSSRASASFDNIHEGYHTLPQYQLPEDDDTVAILKTTYGDIVVALYPEAAPLAVENFITHAKNGYYDGVIFHRVVNDFMIQTGSPLGTSTGGESIWQEGFKDEFHPNYHHFRGALSMAKALHDQNGSQFFIVQAGAVDEGSIQYFTETAEKLGDELVSNRSTGENDPLRDILSEETIRAYGEFGGTPHLDYALANNQHTVFGQVLRGMDIVDQIAEAETDPNDKPVNDIVIKTIEIVQFKDIQ